MNVVEATKQVRDHVYQYLLDVKATTIAMRNLAPVSYEQTFTRVVAEIEEQERRLKMPSEVIFIDEIKPVLSLKNNKGMGEFGRKR